MNQIIKLLTAAMLAATLTACTSPEQDKSSVTSTLQSSTSVLIENPFVECDTLEEAEKMAGFEMTLPDEINGYDDPVFQAVEGKMIQVTYYNDEGNDITIRKSNVEYEDISGDYNDYTWETSYTLMNSTWEDEGCEVTLQGYNNEYATDSEEIHKAIWSHGGYSYSITSTEGVVGEAGIPKIIAGVE